MSWQAVRWVIHDAPVDDATQVLVLLAIAERADEHGRGAYPSARWIAERARCSVRSTHRHIAALRKEGLLRDGDASLVADFRPDRRPSVYDVDMSRRRDGVSPVTGRTEPRGDTDDMSGVARRDTDDMSPMTPRTPPRGVTGGIHGVSPVTDNKSLPPTEVNQPRVVPRSARTPTPPDPSAAVHAGTVVAAWTEACEANGVHPTVSQRGQVGRLARELLERNDPDKVMEAARVAGTKGYATIDRELTVLNGRDVRASTRVPRPSTTNDRVMTGLNLARRYAEAENATPPPNLLALPGATP